MSNQCEISKIMKKSFILASTIDAPIAAVVGPIDVPGVPWYGAAGLTFIGAFINYSIRLIFRECDLPFGVERHPYVGAAIGGATYHGSIDLFNPNGISLQDIAKGSIHQLAYEFSLHNWPAHVGANFTSALVVETGQSLIEGYSIARGLVYGSYAGIILEWAYEPLLFLLGIDEQ